MGKSIQVDKGNKIVKANQGVYEHEVKEKGCD